MDMLYINRRHMNLIQLSYVVIECPLLWSRIYETVLLDSMMRLHLCIQHPAVQLQML